MSVISAFSSAIYTDVETSVAADLPPGAREDRLYDLLHARRHAIRKEFMAQGVAPGTRVDGKEAASRTARALRIRSRPQRKLLDAIVMSLCDADGTIDPEIIGATRQRKGDLEGELIEEGRFTADRGVLRPFQKTLLRAKKSEVGIGSRRDHYARGGKRHTQPPYAVLGDGERMAALDSTALNYKIDVIRGAFQQALAGMAGGGAVAQADLLPRAVFFEGLKRAMQRWKYNNALSWPQCLQIAGALDPQRTGFISVNGFIREYALELMKRPSMRATLGSGDILSWGGWGVEDAVPPPPPHPHVPVPPPARGGDLMSSPHLPRPGSASRSPRGTRAHTARLPYASAFNLGGSHPRNPRPQHLVSGTTRSFVLRTAEAQQTINKQNQSSTGRWAVRPPPALPRPAPPMAQPPGGV